MQHFVNRFVLQPLIEASDPQERFKHAAVLIPLYQKNDQWWVILTQRSAHLRHHPSQISFPGGRFDLGDHNLEYTALRESNEEIDLPMDSAQVIGQMRPQMTVSGFNVTPFVATLATRPVLKANPDEVEQIIELPLAPLLNQDNYQSYRFKRNGLEQDVYFVKQQQHIIWGATAHILRNFAIHCQGF
ncbi:CoA pyrophosphatase [Alginatibacterium sediminis]|uniref:CoA pyrophosphatase n=1 Tax=Alginatibacterium sediminis TaxID=2164068 RepID=A0A420EG94_9ALTE|nr:CoA pyrophosphatase [Alginatibacterium sediminis]RKF19731.1 CoA pyrophosphatase [Alginatibacterium sediminis]